MIIIIAGGRNFENYKLLKFKCDKILKNINEEIIIISGHAPGADSLGEKYAKEKGYKLKIYEADWDNINVPNAIIKTNKYGNLYNANAGFDRNLKMALNADALICFWDGISPGSKNMIDIANDKKLLVRIIKYV